MQLEKSQRIERLKELFTLKEQISRTELLKSLYCSQSTLDRDIKFLKSQGYKLKPREGVYTIIEKPENEGKYINYSYVQLRIFSILTEFIKASNHKVSERYLIDTFVSEDEIDRDDQLKVTKKTLRKKLAYLMEKGVISREKTTYGNVYSLVEDDFNKGLTVEDTIQIIKFIRTNISPLPFNKEFGSIADKLENAVLQDISTKKTSDIGEVAKEIGNSYKVFSNWIDNDVDDRKKAFLDRLIKLCDQSIFLEIYLTGKEKPIRHYPLITVYQVSNDRWYLAVKTSGSARDFDLIRVDGISRINEVANIVPNEKMKKRLKEAKDRAYKEILKSFGTGIGQKSRIKLMIMPDEEVIDLVMLRMENYRCSDIEEAGDGSISYWIEIEGVSNFMHWVRGFGKGIIILEPNDLRELQKETAQKVLAFYNNIN